MLGLIISWPVHPPCAQPDYKLAFFRNMGVAFMLECANMYSVAATLGCRPTLGSYPT